MHTEKPTATPWFTMAQPNPDELHPMVSIWSGTETRESIVCNSCSPADAKLIVASVNQAAQLAEALRISTVTLETVYSNDRKNIAAKCCVERNRKALATYEEGK